MTSLGDHWSPDLAATGSALASARHAPLRLDPVRRARRGRVPDDRRVLARRAGSAGPDAASKDWLVGGGARLPALDSRLRVPRRPRMAADTSARELHPGCRARAVLRVPPRRVQLTWRLNASAETMPTIAIPAPTMRSSTGTSTSPAPDSVSLGRAVRSS